MDEAAVGNTTVIIDQEILVWPVSGTAPKTLQAGARGSASATEWLQTGT